MPITIRNVYDNAVSFDVSVNEPGSGVTCLEHRWNLE